MRSFFEGSLELLLPAACIHCLGRVSGGGELFAGILPYLQRRVCSNCLPSWQHLSEPFCTVCSLPYEGEGVSHPCPSCLKNPPPFDELISWGRYDGLLKVAIQLMKYGGDLRFCKILLELFIAACMKRWGAKPPFDLIVPVPPHRRSLFERGFDLPSLLAGKIAKRWKIPVDYGCLAKENSSVKMAELGLKKRKEAVRGLYSAGVVRGGRVLLVDDVATSLETLRKCSRLLLRGGAYRVSCATLARTPVAPKK